MNKRNMIAGLVIGIMFAGAVVIDMQRAQLVESREQIEYLTNMLEDNGALTEEKTIEIEQLTAENDDLYERNVELSNEIEQLKEEIEELQQPVVEEEPIEEPEENMDKDAKETGTFIAENNEYYHHYSDCPFIRNKEVTETVEVGNRYACKCVHQGVFWE